MSVNEKDKNEWEISILSLYGFVLQEQEAQTQL